MLEEVFPGMRIGAFVWKTRAGTRGEGSYFSQDNEYVLVFGAAGFRFGGTSPDLAKYTNDDEDSRGLWTSVALQTNKDRFERPNSFFPVQNPKTGHWHPCNPNRVWGFQLRSMGTARGATFEDLFEAKKLLFSREGEFVEYRTKAELLAAIKGKFAHPYLTADLPNLEFWVGKPIALGSVRKKQFLSELKQDTKPTSSWIDSLGGEAEDPEVVILRSGMTQEGTRAITEIFGARVFNYAKPTSLIRGLIEQSTSPGDIVLDFFAGSATTAQAVMELNAADGGDRRFIMASSTERTADEPDKNICRDVTAERIRRLNASTEGTGNDLSAEFAYLRCREIEFTDIDYSDGLEPAEAWNALEALHSLPLTPHKADRKWQAHEGEDVTLVQVDKFAADLLSYLEGLAARRVNAFVYAWAPGQVRDAIGGVDFEVRPIRDTLVRRFQQ